MTIARINFPDHIEYTVKRKSCFPFCIQSPLLLNVDEQSVFENLYFEMLNC